MANLIDSASELLDRVRKSHLSSEIEFVRGAGAATLMASVGTTTFDQDSGNGVIHRVESRDFIFSAADLVIDGSAITPTAGDFIRETSGGFVRTYQVMSDLGEAPWKYSDSLRRTIRVHTLHRSTEAVEQ